MQPEVLFEDSSLLVLNKPPNWIVNDANTARGQDIIQNWIAKNFKHSLAKNRLFRNGIVHRIDKETSGILLVAKTEDAFRDLQKQFKQRLVKKSYLALVHGQVLLPEGEVIVPLGRLSWRRDRFGVIPGGRKAETRYLLKEKYIDKKGEKYSLLQCFPKTGRTHQIRVHMKYLGHSIVGDQFYAGRKISRKDRKWCPRSFLHAEKISFKHPESKKRVEYTSKLSSDLSKALKTLSKE